MNSYSSTDINSPFTYVSVNVFCQQGIDVKSMGRIFVGLVKCGAWGCFDEFNRLEEAVLSAVSMQIQVIQDTIKDKASSAELLGRMVGYTERMQMCASMMLKYCCAYYS